MKLVQVILKNFRGYLNETRIDLDDLTAFIGKNDAGKSTVLEALEIFFNNSTIKIDRDDASQSGDPRSVTIGCVFDDLPTQVVVDTSNPTTLDDEFLVNEHNQFEVYKVFNCGVQRIGKPKISAVANHPTVEGLDDLLSLSISQLKSRWNSTGINDDEVRMNRSASIRQALWRSSQDLQLSRTEISLDEADGKKIWDSLSKSLPIFGLFSADRQSRDGDSEVQDPMKIAVRSALNDLENELKHIADAVHNRVLDVANRTVQKIHDMDPTLADNLSPRFRESPKWDTIFKLSLTGEDEIPINKRGSGVRRLILINFFRAEVERKKAEIGSPSTVYAIEEPETSQHPNNQRMLIQALQELSETNNSQVLLSTHVPGLAASIPVTSLRYIDRDGSGHPVILSGSEQVYRQIAETLGVIPDHRVKVLLCVEGINDVAFFYSVGKLLNQSDNSMPDIKSDPRIAIIELGGSSLKHWVDNHYLREIGIPEFHIYDRDDPNSPNYSDACNQINARGDGSKACLTHRKEIENYYHTDLIYNEFQVRLNPARFDDVPALIRSNLPSSGVDLNKAKIKERLAKYCAPQMTLPQLQAVDQNHEIRNWFAEIAQYLN